MNASQLVALIIAQGLPTALEIVKILKDPSETVTPEQLDRLEQLASRTAADYKRELQG